MIQSDSILIKSLFLCFSSHEADDSGGVALELVHTAWLDATIWQHLTQQHFKFPTLHHELAHTHIEQVLVLSPWDILWTGASHDHRCIT